MKALLQLLKRILHPFYFRIYRVTRKWHKGPEPLDPKDLMQNPNEGFWATPTFRYFRAWPWDRQRPRWLPAYRTPDHTPSPGNILPYSERSALNNNGPVEAYGQQPGATLWVRRSVHGAKALDARFSAHGRQYSSDVWCLVEIPLKWLRSDMHNYMHLQTVTHGTNEFFLAWVPAIWLAAADV